VEIDMAGTSLGTLAAAALLLAGGPAAAQPVPAGSTYVALGSSFAAGPGVTREAADGVARCSQSQDNYARQLARMRKLKLVDRSCGGATTVHVLKGGQFGLPAQVEALTPETRLVTVTIGGNDVRYMADLGLEGCRNHPERVPEALRARLCAAPAAFDLEAAFTRLATNLRAVAAEVRRRSPRARLVFVDYVSVLPAGAPCPAVPLTRVQAEAMRARAARLAALTATVARESGAGLVKASELSRDHALCTDAPWVQGFVFRRAPGDWGPAGFHPTLPAMTAIAHALDAQLGR
jgi:lysophospholipase L1-like esterase